MSDIIVVEEYKASEIFSENGKAMIMDRLKEVTSEPQDITTEAGRKKINSVARKIGGLRTKINDYKKSSTEEWRKLINDANANAKDILDAVDAFKDEYRRPLAEYEEAEKERKQTIENSIQVVCDFQTVSIDGVSQAEHFLSSLLEAKNLEYMEFQSIFDAEYAKAEIYLNDQLAHHKKLEEQRKELERIEQERQEAAARQKAEEMQRKAEEEARLKIEREKQEQADRIKQDEIRKERERISAEEAEKQRIRDEHEAEKRRIQKEHDDAMAKERAEKEKIEREKREAQARAADKEHKKSIHRDILSAMVDLGITDDQAKDFIRNVVSGKVPHIKIQY